MYQAFPLDTPEAEMQAWRTQARARLELQYEGTPTSAGTFAADAARYLRAVQAMPDYKNRARDIEDWLPLFGRRRTVTIQPHEIRAQRDTWLLRGPKRVYNKATRTWDSRAEPLAASTVNHRLRALQNLVTVLYPSHDNPVKHVPDAEEPEAEDRSVPYDVIAAILAAMPDRGRGTKGHQRPPVSEAKIRCGVFAYTGITPMQMRHLHGPDDFDLDAPAIRKPRRRKGKGVAGAWTPVPREAVPWLRAFIDAELFRRRFSRDSVRQAWQRACVRVGLPKIRLYDLRHSYGTAMLEQTGDLHATQRLLTQADPRTTQRYAKRAIPAWLSAAVAKVRLRRA